LNWTDHRKTYRAFRCVLHALRDHLSPKDAAYLGNQLPLLIRGFYFDRWNPTMKPVLLRNGTDFLSVVSEYIDREEETSADAEIVSRAVFRLLERKATEGEIEDLRNVIPAGVLDLWPPTLRAA